MVHGSWFGSGVQEVSGRGSRRGSLNVVNPEP
jgi:hypothetical protein